MKLIFLYGPPGVGKLSVGKEIQRLSGYKLFHNHLTHDLATSLFEMDKDDFYNFIFDIRIFVFKKIFKSKIKGIVFTYVYLGLQNDYFFIKKMLDLAKKNNTQVYFIRIKCKEKILLRRIQDKKRKQYGKVTSLNIFKKRLKKLGLAIEDLNRNIDEVKSFVYDNSEYSPTKMAKIILKDLKI